MIRKIKQPVHHRSSHVGSLGSSRRSITALREGQNAKRPCRGFVWRSVEARGQHQPACLALTTPLMWPSGSRWETTRYDSSFIALCKDLGIRLRSSICTPLFLGACLLQSCLYAVQNETKATLVTLTARHDGCMSARNLYAQCTAAGEVSGDLVRWEAVQ